MIRNKRNAMHLTPDEVLDIVRAALHTYGIPTAVADVKWHGDRGIVVRNVFEDGDIVAHALLDNCEKDYGPIGFWEAIGRCSLDCDTAERVLSTSTSLVLDRKNSDLPMIRRKRKAGNGQ